MIYQFETFAIRADEIIQTNVREPLEGGLPFSNLHFSCKRDFPSAKVRGAGLYACLFRGELLYIGRYFGKRNNWRKGNVVKDRWRRHIGTITLRFRRVGFTKGALKEISDHLKSSWPVPKEIAEGFANAKPEFFGKDTGNMSTFRRFQVAAIHWSYFSGHPTSWLSDFTFLYVQLGVDAPFGTKYVRDRIKKAETDLLKEIHPPANTIKNARQTNLPDCPPVESPIAELLRTQLETALAQ